MTEPVNYATGFRDGMLALVEMLAAPPTIKPAGPAKAAKPGQWKARHLDAPDKFNPDGTWRDGVDRFAL